MQQNINSRGIGLKYLNTRAYRDINSLGLLATGSQNTTSFSYLNADSITDWVIIKYQSELLLALIWFGPLDFITLYR